MWAKLYSKVQQLVTKEENQDSKKIIRLAIQEVEVAIEKNNAVLKNTLVKQKELISKLQEAENEQNLHHQKALDAVKNKHERLAEMYLEKENTTKLYKNKLAEMCKEINLTVSRIEKQLVRLKIQKEEIENKEAILSAKLESANTQRSLEENLAELDKDNHIELFEEEVLKMEIQADMAEEVLSLDDEIAQIELNDDVNSLQEELNTLQIEEQRKKDIALQKRIQQLMRVSPEKEQQLLKTKLEENAKKKSEVIASWEKDRKNSDQKSQKDLINDFFSEKQSKIPAKPEENPSIEKDKKSIMDDFFKQSEQQNKIDDFFNTEDE
ncbi:PspA/IM30 family protein [Sediminitomix flava]|uniref:Phage shock protein A n=1 Tax=Sediminitomix flava TaxID=379075 RepID=A0A315Z0D6_SEDFL|nr:hypothetical protein [Sediminitomix flava]PWJ36012.1 phage shock protein A [Sediminitomix flava]